MSAHGLRVPRCRKCGAQEEIYRIEEARVGFPLFEVSKGGLPLCGDLPPDDGPVWHDLGLHCEACDEWITPNDVEMTEPQLLCAECGDGLIASEAVWIDPATRAATMAGRPFHASCAPAQYSELDT